MNREEILNAAINGNLSRIVEHIDTLKPRAFGRALGHLVLDLETAIDNKTAVAIVKRIIDWPE